jgi:hypothetical protein
MSLRAHSENKDERNPSLLERWPMGAERKGCQGRAAVPRAAEGGASHP